MSTTRGTRGRRRALLIVHIASSEGWFGVSLTMLTLGIAGKFGDAGRSTEGAYWAAHIFVDVLVITLSLLSLGSGVALGLVTHWGLWRHKWVTVKLTRTLITTALGLFSLRPGVMDAYRASGPNEDHGALDQAGAGLLYAGGVSTTTYLCFTVISVLKPWGPTRRARAAVAKRA